MQKKLENILFHNLKRALRLFGWLVQSETEEDFMRQSILPTNYLGTTYSKKLRHLNYDPMFQWPGKKPTIETI